MSKRQGHFVGHAAGRPASFAKELARHKAELAESDRRIRAEVALRVWRQMYPPKTEVGDGSE